MDVVTQTSNLVPGINREGKSPLLILSFLKNGDFQGVAFMIEAVSVPSALFGHVALRNARVIVTAHPKTVDKQTGALTFQSYSLDDIAHPDPSVGFLVGLPGSGKSDWLKSFLLSQKSTGQDKVCMFKLPFSTSLIIPQKVVDAIFVVLS